MNPDPLLLATSASHQAHRQEAPVPPDQFNVSLMEGVLIVEPIGALDDESMQTLDRLLDATDTPVVVDLRHCEPGDAVAFLLLAPRYRRSAPGNLSVVCDRTDPLPQRPGTDGDLAVFQQPADAVQALMLAESGYGNGWT